MSYILQDLNESQKQVVTTIEGPVLVVAGPGTGKTLTIVRRIAYLVSQGVNPENILAVTFTNRAAKEMQERAESLLGKHADNLFIGTFHVFGVKVLKDTHAQEFVILDRDKQIELIKPLCKNSGLRAPKVADEISLIKNFIKEPDEGIKKIYREYQAALKKNSAFDFDDLILKSIEMLSNQDIIESFRDRFRYIMVDEYQDINPAQYSLLKLIAGDRGNLCAVGDSDQAIYAFRGADVGNFLNFESDFKDARRITLTENYRSNSVVLNASNIMIKNNSQRIDKEIRAVREEGNVINVISVPDERKEAEIIVNEIEKRIGGTSHYQLMRTGAIEDNPDCSYRFSDFAVIFRTNAQARALEETFISSGIPYQVVGGRGSLQMKEIEETLAYLKSLIDQRDDNDSALNLNATDGVSLLTPPDFFDPGVDAVTLMTMHMAKGLEFKIVFITGAEDGLIPFTLKKEGVDIEEERRLFYVGMTRAKDELFITYARKRFIYGQRLSQGVSPFLKEIPAEFIENIFIPDRIKKPREEKQIGLF
jgi:superfamily I DNA/RNA helicase